jgi:hypothetical protein
METVAKLAKFNLFNMLLGLVFWNVHPRMVFHKVDINKMYIMNLFQT